MTSDDIQTRLGENVKRIRKELKLTQFQLAEKADLSEETVKNIELSRCWTSDKNLAKLTKALQVDTTPERIPHARPPSRRMIGSCWERVTDLSRR